MHTPKPTVEGLTATAFRFNACTPASDPAVSCIQLRQPPSSLLLQHLVQLAAQGCSQWRRHCIAHLPVARVHIAAEKEVVREALCGSKARKREAPVTFEARKERDDPM